MPDRAAVYYRVPTDLPVGFITIDDGYASDPDATAFVQANTIPVTQFLTYYAASGGAFPPPSSGPGLANIQELRKYQTGTADQKRVGCHQKEHIDYRARTIPDQQSQMSAAADWLGGSDMFSGRPRLFRPPYGYYNDQTMQAAHGASMPKLVLWTHVWIDGVIVNEWGSPRMRGGDIVLLHHPSTSGQNGYLLGQLNVALAAIAAANLVPAYLHDFL